ncbi:MAG: arsenate reductase (glutaredoxin) [Flavobacteriaceae bacterium]|nr:arsenate reductase (glutaredoxin) [Flavobacteriaceae bacterium]
MLTIYHNPRCSKSRGCNTMLLDLGKEVKVINYIKDLFTEEALQEVIKKLNIKPIELVRTNEQEWKDNFKGKTLSDSEVINAMVAYPKLIQRPIVVNGNKAVIGRPLELVETIL